MTNHNPDVSQYPTNRYGNPIVPREEWRPLRPICAELGYDFPHAVNSGWARRVNNWDFTGNGSPDVLAIHESVLPDFRVLAGGEPEEHEPTVFESFIVYTEALGEANEAYGKTVDEARAVRRRAVDEANRNRNQVIDEAERVRSQAHRDAEAAFYDAMNQHWVGHQ